MSLLIVLLFISVVALVLAVIGYWQETKNQKRLFKLNSYRGLYYKGMPDKELRYLNSKVSQLQGF